MSRILALPIFLMKATHSGVVMASLGEHLRTHRSRHEALVVGDSVVPWTTHSGAAGSRQHLACTSASVCSAFVRVLLGTPSFVSHCLGSGSSYVVVAPRGRLWS